MLQYPSSANVAEVVGLMGLASHQRARVANSPPSTTLQRGRVR